MRYYITDKKKGKVLNRLSLAVLTGFLVFYISLWHTFLQNSSLTAPIGAVFILIGVSLKLRLHLNFRLFRILQQ